MVSFTSSVDARLPPDLRALLRGGSGSGTAATSSGGISGFNPANVRDRAASASSNPSQTGQQERVTPDALNGQAANQQNQQQASTTPPQPAVTPAGTFLAQLLGQQQEASAANSGQSASQTAEKAINRYQTASSLTNNSRDTASTGNLVDVLPPGGTGGNAQPGQSFDLVA